MMSVAPLGVCLLRRLLFFLSLLFSFQSFATETKDFLFILYLNADNSLDRQVGVIVSRLQQLKELKNTHVTVYFDGERLKDTHWYYLTEGLGGVRSVTVKENIEMDSASSDTIVDFVAWSLANFPARKNIFLMAAHGFGVHGLTEARDHCNFIDDRQSGNVRNDDHWTRLLETELKNQNKKIDLFVYYSCLMGEIENLLPFKRITEAVVASKTSIWLDKNPYSTLARGIEPEKFIAFADAHPEVNAVNLAEHIVDNFRKSYEAHTFEDAPGFLKQHEAALAVFDLNNLEPAIERLNETARRILNHPEKEEIYRRIIIDLLSFPQSVSYEYFDYGVLLDYFASLTENTTDTVNWLTESDRPMILKRYDRNNEFPVDQQLSGLSVYFPNFYAWFIKRTYTTSVFQYYASDIPEEFSDWKKFVSDYYGFVRENEIKMFMGFAIQRIFEETDFPASRWGPSELNNDIWLFTVVETLLLRRKKDPEIRALAKDYISRIEKALHKDKALKDHINLLKDAYD
jgi:hypothetical protein